MDASCIDKPRHTDVLLGRGVSTNRRAGNTYYRAIVSQHAEEYRNSTKTHKMQITRIVINHIHTLNPPGRFLEKETRSGRWKEVDMKRAHEKTAQALRDGALLRTKRPPLSDESLAELLSTDTEAKTHRRDISVDAADMMKEEVEEVRRVLYSPIFSAASNVDVSAAPDLSMVVTPCPISPCPSASASLNQDYHKDCCDGAFGGLTFHAVDCCCKANEKFDDLPIGDMTCSDDSIDSMVDMPDEDIFLLWLTC
ncbi:hypothetical protein ACHAXM_004869 [Skeletonema potamos]